MPLKDDFILGGTEDRIGNSETFLRSRRGVSRKIVDATSPGVVSDAEGRQSPEGIFDTALDRAGRDDLLFTNRLDYANLKTMTFRLRVPNAKREGDRYVGGSTLTLLINPNNLSIGQTAAYDVVLAREGQVTSHWGHNQITITGGGKSPAFVNTIEGLSATALWKQGFQRKGTLGYAHMMSLVAFFKNNGYQYLSKTDNNATLKGGLTQTRSARSIMVLNDVEISYDGTTYLGTFNSFTMTESADSPYNFDWSFDFTAHGVRGDTQQGHLNDGRAQRAGIILAVQGDDHRIVSNYNLNMNVSQEVLDEWLPVRGIGEEPPPNDAAVVIGKTQSQVEAQTESLIGGLSAGCARVPTSPPPVVEITDLVPIFQAKVRDLVAQCKAKGIIIHINSGYRDNVKQAAIKGNDPKRAANPGRSLHNYGLAVDLQEWKEGKLIPSWDSAGRQNEIGDIAVKLGLRWGKNFNNVKEAWHFEIDYTKAPLGFSSVTAFVDALIASKDNCSDKVVGPVPASSDSSNDGKGYFE